MQKLAAEATRLAGARWARALAQGGRAARDHYIRSRKNTMRTIHLIAAACMLLAGGVSQCPAQEAGHDSHHPVAGAGGPAPDPSPELMAMPEMMAPGSSKGGSMSPDMARMMPAMMKNMCAMMMGEGGGNTMAGPQGAGMPVSGPIDPVTGAFEAINRRMHEGMAADASAGADRAFVAAMIAHHQGAIDMAKVILAFGSDPKIRTLAEQVIKAQEGEIAFMQQWQAEQPQP